MEEPDLGWDESDRERVLRVLKLISLQILCALTVMCHPANDDASNEVVNHF